MPIPAPFASCIPSQQLRTELTDRSVWHEVTGWTLSGIKVLLSPPPPGNRESEGGWGEGDNISLMAGKLVQRCRNLLLTMCPKPFPSVLLLDVVALDRQRGTTVIVPNLPISCCVLPLFSPPSQAVHCSLPAGAYCRPRPACPIELPPFSRPPLPRAVSQTACPYCLAGCIRTVPLRHVLQPLANAQCCSPVAGVSQTAVPPAPRSVALQTSAARLCTEP